MLLGRVPAAVPGIAFLSGGQSNEWACANGDQLSGGRRQGADWRLTSRSAVRWSTTRCVSGTGACRDPAAQDARAANCARRRRVRRGYRLEALPVQRPTVSTGRRAARIEAGSSPQG